MPNYYTEFHESLSPAENAEFRTLCNLLLAEEGFTKRQLAAALNYADPWCLTAALTKSGTSYGRLEKAREIARSRKIFCGKLTISKIEEIFRRDREIVAQEMAAELKTFDSILSLLKEFC
jgi:hypothetical protein